MQNDPPPRAHGGCPIKMPAHALRSSRSASRAIWLRQAEGKHCGRARRKDGCQSSLGVGERVCNRNNEVTANLQNTKAEVFELLPKESVLQNQNPCLIHVLRGYVFPCPCPLSSVSSQARFPQQPHIVHKLLAKPTTHSGQQAD